MAAHALLRAATAADHAEVDAAFARFDLQAERGYGAFLQAHALALPAVEAALRGVAGLPPLRSRVALLHADLAALGRPVPEPFPLKPPASDAGAYGMAYVIEGSRLGGAVLERLIGPGLPRAYLSATHLTGEWRAFGRSLDTAAERGGADWLDEAIAAARGVFSLYARAAA